MTLTLNFIAATIYRNYSEIHRKNKSLSLYLLYVFLVILYVLLNILNSLLLKGGMNALGRKPLMTSDIYFKIYLLLPNCTIMKSKLDHKNQVPLMVCLVVSER